MVINKLVNKKNLYNSKKNSSNCCCIPFPIEDIPCYEIDDLGSYIYVLSIGLPDYSYTNGDNTKHSISTTVYNLVNGVLTPSTYDIGYFGHVDKNQIFIASDNQDIFSMFDVAGLNWSSNFNYAASSRTLSNDIHIIDVNCMKSLTDILLTITPIGGQQIWYTVVVTRFKILKEFTRIGERQSYILPYVSMFNYINGVGNTYLYNQDAYLSHRSLLYEEIEYVDDQFKARSSVLNTECVIQPYAYYTISGGQHSGFSEIVVKNIPCCANNIPIFQHSIKCGVDMNSDEFYQAQYTYGVRTVQALLDDIELGISQNFNEAIPNFIVPLKDTNIIQAIPEVDNTVAAFFYISYPKYPDQYNDIYNHTVSGKYTVRLGCDSSGVGGLECVLEFIDSGYISIGETVERQIDLIYTLAGRSYTIHLLNISYLFYNIYPHPSNNLELWPILITYNSKTAQLIFGGGGLTSRQSIMGWPTSAIEYMNIVGEDYYTYNTPPPEIIAKSQDLLLDNYISITSEGINNVAISEPVVSTLLYYTERVYRNYGFTGDPFFDEGTTNGLINSVSGEDILYYDSLSPLSRVKYIPHRGTFLEGYLEPQYTNIDACVQAFPTGCGEEPPSDITIIVPTLGTFLLDRGYKNSYALGATAYDSREMPCYSYEYIKGDPSRGNYTYIVINLWLTRKSIRVEMHYTNKIQTGFIYPSYYTYTTTTRCGRWKLNSDPILSYCSDYGSQISVPNFNFDNSSMIWFSCEEANRITDSVQVTLNYD